MALIPCLVSSSQSSIIGLTIFPNPFGYNFSSRQESSLLQANKIIASGSCCSPITLYERMNPVEPPQRICGQHGGMIQDRPILMHDRKESVHLIGDFPEMGREVISHIDRLFAVASAKLRNI